MNVAQNTGTVGLNAIDALYNSVYIDIYSGTQPATPETALSGNTVLVTGIFAATAFGTPTYGSSKMSASASFTAASYAPAATGTASFARVTKSDHTTVICDLTCGTSGTDIIMGSTSITTGVNVSFTLTNTIPAL
jgi:hypothetical protein